MTLIGVMSEVCRHQPKKAGNKPARPVSSLAMIARQSASSSRTRNSSRRSCWRTSSRCTSTSGFCIQSSAQRSISARLSWWPLEGGGGSNMRRRRLQSRARPAAAPSGQRAPPKMRTPGTTSDLGRRIFQQRDCGGCKDLHLGFGLGVPKRIGGPRPKVPSEQIRRCGAESGAQPLRRTRPHHVDILWGSTRRTCINEFV